MNLLRANARSPARPAAVAAVALTLIIQLVGSWAPPAASAADPTLPDATPAPLQSPVATSDPAPDPTVDPAPDATPDAGSDPTPDPTADPGATPEPTLAPDPTSDPGSSTEPAPGPEASAEPSATPDPTPIPWDLSPGQQAGSDVAAPMPLYRLQSNAAPLDAVPAAIHSAVGIDSPDCAACHSAHRGESAYLVGAPQPGSTLCLTCHSGGSAPFTSPYDVAAQLTAKPANDPTTDSYFQHLVETGTGRQVTCTSCHNPHDANSSRPSMSLVGWTASGDIRAADGVAVTNGAAATAPTYTAISRAIGGDSLALEYQLCLACHSGATTLPTANAAHPSWWALDKGIELNPANVSFHPIEAAGKNQSTQMAASLAGTSPTKAWDFDVDSTIRCTACHGDPSTVDQTATATPKRPSADSQEATHASANRGILIAPYRDRVLKGETESYDPNDFALCYLCHAEAPFADPNYNPSAAATAFSLHGMHVSGGGWDNGGAGSSIDVAGDGAGGLALCAECHFRIHSTAIAYKAGDTGPIARAANNPGLVDFAPNVGGARLWTVPGSTGTGSCTLTCHGFSHTAVDTTYHTAPGTGFSASLTNGPVGPSGLTVQFTDLTRYIGTSNATWAWDFGDGATSTQQHPLHVYTSIGTYAVTLTVTRTTDHLSATMTKASYIRVVP